jgi:hypothetical protein
VEDLVVPPGGPQGAVSADDFSLVQVYDMGWLVDPSYQRMLQNLAASPGAYKTVRVMKVFTNSINAPTAPPENGIFAANSGGTVWPAGGTIDFAGTLDALYALTSEGLVPFVVLGFFPDGVYGDTSITPPMPFGPSNPSAADWTTILNNWQTLVTAFFNALFADSRFSAPSSPPIATWWFEVWNEPDIDWAPDALNLDSGELVYYPQLYQATSDAVNATGHRDDVRLGGPTVTAQNFVLNPTGPPQPDTIMANFVQFLVNNPVQCDFLSFHAKGNWQPCLNATVPSDLNALSGAPELQMVVAAADQAAQLVQDAHLTSIATIVNNEADMRAYFALPFKPRMTEQYPAWLTALTIAYDALSSEYAPIRFMLGSDNAELPLVGYTETQNLQSAAFVASSFGQQRSIMTAASTWDEGSCPTDLLKVPVYGYYELLRLLGDQHGAFLSGSNNYYPNPAANPSDLFHAITVASDHIGSFFCVYPPTPPGAGASPESWDLHYSIVGISWPKINWYQFQIDGTHSNGFTAANGPSQEPDATSCTQDRPPASFLSLDGLPVPAIRQAQELSVVSANTNMSLPDGVFKTELTIPQPPPYQTTVFWITEYVMTALDAPEWGLSSPAVLDPNGNVVLRWTPSTDATFYSYQVYRDELADPVSPVPLRSALWVDTNPGAGTHSYYVVAVNASGNPSDKSPPQTVTVP